MKPRHWAFLLLGLVLVIGPAFAEVLYQHSARRQYDDLWELLDRTHPGGHGYDLIRYGQGSGGEPWNSLRRDCWAWLTRKAGLPSLLDGAYESEGAASYLELQISSVDERPGLRSAHTFDWSPRRWCFVPVAVHCRQPGCPWSADAPSAR